MKSIWIGTCKLFGWKFVTDSRPELHHCVMIEAPHTSAMDFFLGYACVKKLGLKAHIFVKKEFFNIITKPFLHHWGCIAVDRGNKHNGLVETAVRHLRNQDDFTMIVTPEGTRKAVKRWKRGFYEIALQANVPIVLSYIDYGKKEMGVGPTFYPTGDFSADLKEIMKFYENITARHPQDFNPKPLA